MSIAIVYGSTGGNTEVVAKKIQSVLGGDVALLDIGDTDADTINGYEALILGTSTWYDGELQDDWDSFDFDSLELEGKKVAFFGLGDQQGYGHEFCNGMGILYEKAKQKGAIIIGDGWSIDGYDFEASDAVVDGAFVGLAIDEDNEDELTDERIEAWIQGLKTQL
jgi:flavodoxin I